MNGTPPVPALPPPWEFLHPGEAGALALPAPLPLAGAQFDWRSIPFPISFPSVFGSIGSFFSDPPSLSELGGAIVDFLWKAVWTNVGGGVRWVWDRLTDAARFGWGVTATFAGWLWDQLSPAFTWTQGLIVTFAHWLWQQVEPAFTTLGRAVAGAAGWLWDQTAAGLRFTWGVVGSFAGWLWDHVSAGLGTVTWAAWDAAGWAFRNVSDVIAGVATQVWDAGGWLWGQTSAGLQWTVQQVGDIAGGALDAVGNAFQSSVEFLLDRLIGPVADTVQAKLEIPFKLVRGEYTSIDQFLADVTDPPVEITSTMVGALLFPLVMIFSLLPLITGGGALFAQPVLQEYAQRFGDTLPPVGTVLEARNRRVIGAEKMDEWLGRAGFGPPALAMYEELRHPLPSPTDLVRFGVREVFTPEVVQRFGQHLNFPPQFAEEMALQGYPEERALQFWAAHWDLPSPEQGFVMLHRKVELDDHTTFGEADLDLLLRALDVMPFWRGPLKQIAFHPLTRVDIRRMHNLGLLNEEQLVTRYEALGFKPEDAALMAQFTIRFNADDESDSIDDVRQLTQAQVRQLYRRGVIERDDAIDRLVSLRYTEDDAEFFLSLDDIQLGLRPDTDRDIDIRQLTAPVIRQAYREAVFSREDAQRQLEALGYLPASADTLLSLEDVRRDQQTTDLQLRLIREQYAERAFTREQAAAQMDALGVNAAERDTRLALWDLDQTRSPRRLTRTDIVRAFERQVFDLDGALDELASLGYGERDAGIILGVAERAFSQRQLFELLTAGLIDEPTVRDGLRALGYSPAAGDLIMQLAAQPSDEAA